MGNCSLKSVGTSKSYSNSIRIMKGSGEILELEGPKLVRQVVNDFPGYGIFKKNGVSSPLPDQEKLLNSHIYYLLPLAEVQKKVPQNNDTTDHVKDPSMNVSLSEVDAVEKKVESTDGKLKDLKSLNEVKFVEKGPISSDDHIKDLSAKMSLSDIEPVRMSSAASDIVMNLANGSGLEVLPPPQKGVWRVKLVINPKQLEEIFSQEVNTEALIEQMRMAAASGKVTPRRAKSYLGLFLKPILCNVFKVPTDDHQNDQQNNVEPMDLCISSPIKG